MQQQQTSRQARDIFSANSGNNTKETPTKTTTIDVMLQRMHQQQQKTEMEEQNHWQ